jgi:hypothetical protein
LHLAASTIRAMRSAILVLVVLLGACQPSEPVEPANLIVAGDRLFLAATINGSACEALLDSAAEMTLLDQAFAASIGLATFGVETARGTGGQAEVSFAEGVQIQAAGLALDGLTVAVLDLSDIADRLVGRPVPAIIGRELFDAARFEIDIHEGILRAVESEPAPQGARLDMQTHRGVQTIPVRIDGGAPVQADFDLGNGSEVLIGEDYARRSGLLASERIVGRKRGGGIGGELWRDLVVLRELEIGGVVFRDIPAAIDRSENAADGNIGVTVLRNFRMTVDFADSAVWLQHLD